MAKCICNTTVVVKRLSITITHLTIPFFLLHQQSTNFGYISITHNPPNSTSTIPSPRHILVYLLLTVLSAAVMTSLFQKLTRPFTSSTLRFAPEQTARIDVPDGAQVVVTQIQVMPQLVPHDGDEPTEPSAKGQPA